MKKIVRTAISVAVLLFSFLLSTTYANAQSARYIDAIKNYQQGDFKEAESLLLAEVSANPDNDAAYYYLATIASADRTRDLETESFMKKAIELSPDNFWYRYALASFYVDTDRQELAVKIMEKLIEEFPDKTDIYFDIINIYLSDNDIDKALSTLDKIEALKGKKEVVGITRAELMLKRPDANPDSVYSYLENFYNECKTPRLATMLGDFYANAYKDSLALHYYNEATALDPDYTPAYYGKANVYQMLRQYDNFFSSITHVMKDPTLATQPKSEYVEHMLSNPQFVKIFAEDFDQMMIDLHQTHPTDSTINRLLGSYYYRTGREYLSIEVMRQNMEAYPESPSIAMDYLILLYYGKNWSALENAATIAMDRFPGEADFIQMRAISYSMTENRKAAIEDYQSILKLNPKDTTVAKVTYSSLGDLYYQSGDKKNSFKCYDKSLKIDPDYNPVLNNYAYYLSLDGTNLKKARTMSKKTIESEPDNPTYLDTYAWILHLMGDDIEAKAIFKHAMLYGGKEDDTILEHYATVLDALGEKDLAKVYFNQVKVMREGK